MLTSQARRTARYDVGSAWEALLDAKNPKEILGNERLLSARAEINEEVEKHTHTPPKFSKDGKIAVLRIHSAAQIHPVIATRWVSAYFHLLLLKSHLNILPPFPPSQALGAPFSNSHNTRPVTSPPKPSKSS